MLGWYLEFFADFLSCLYNSIETWSRCFLFVLENSSIRERKLILIMKICISVCSRHLYVEELVVVMGLRRFIETGFKIQSARVFSLDCFLKENVETLSGY